VSSSSVSAPRPSHRLPRGTPKRVGAVTGTRRKVDERRERSAEEVGGGCRRRLGEGPSAREGRSVVRVSGREENETRGLVVDDVGEHERAVVELTADGRAAGTDARAGDALVRRDPDLVRPVAVAPGLRRPRGGRAAM